MVVAMLLLFAFAACGGGGGGSSDAAPITPAENNSGVFGVSTWDSGDYYGL